MILEPLHAFVLAGGLGLRLRPVVGALPKALAPVGGRPFLSYILAYLQRNGVRQVTLCTGYGAAAVRSFAGSGADWGIHIDYSEEVTPLGTGGAVRLALERCTDDRVLVLNGDSYFDIRLQRLAEAHRDLGGLATLAARRTAAAGRFGALTIDPSGRVLEFREKAQEGAADINAGIYVLERSVMDASSATMPFSLERDVFPALIDGTGGRLKAVVFDGFFVDIGIPDDHATVDRDATPLLGGAAPC